MDFSFSDFHMHSFLSDGIMLPHRTHPFCRRQRTPGGGGNGSCLRIHYGTDHPGSESGCGLAEKYWGITAIAGGGIDKYPCRRRCPPWRQEPVNSEPNWW